MSTFNFKTNFTSSDGFDLGEKFISKDYLLSAYPNLADSLSTSKCYGVGYSGSNTWPQTGDYIRSINGKVRNVSASRWTSGFASNYHYAIIKSDGTLWTVGYNSYGQLGLGNKTTYTSFVKVGTDTDWKHVYCGNLSTIAIKNDGSMWSCGRNDNRQLGLGDNVDRTSFTRIGSDNDWKYAVLGQYHGAAIKEDGTLWTWGTNTNGVLGINSSNNSIINSTPQKTTNSKWIYIDANNYSSCAIRDDGWLYAWGNLFYFDLTQVQDSPFPISSGPWKKIACGYNHSAAIKEDGTLWSIGSNWLGGLGIDEEAESATDGYATFQQVYNKGIWKTVSCGNFFTVAIRSDGTAWSWGNNKNDQLGIDPTVDHLNSPSKIGNRQWSMVDCAAFGFFGQNFWMQ